MEVAEDLESIRQAEEYKNKGNEFFKSNFLSLAIFYLKKIGLNYKPKFLIYIFFTFRFPNFKSQHIYVSSSDLVNNSNFIIFQILFIL